MVTALGGSTEEPANGVPDILRCHGSALTIERSRQAVFRSLNRDAIVLGPASGGSASRRANVGRQECCALHTFLRMSGY